MTNTLNKELNVFIDKVKDNHGGEKFMIETHGCQMNEHDSDKIKWLMESMGFVSTEDEKEADYIIINTCSVRHSAEDKVIGRLGRLKHLKKTKKDLRVGVCGCMMQRKVSRDFVLEKFPFVDLIFGTNNIYRLPQLILASDEDNDVHVEIEESYSNLDNKLRTNIINNQSAYINIMYGCNNFCTYCIVPYTRGREVSRELEDILDEAKALVEDGVKEIILLGQNVNSYGKSLDNPISFAELLRALHEIEGLERINYMTSHPKDISDDLINCYKDLPKLANYLHLPVQSGSNRVLKLMNRHYTREDYFEIIDKVRKIRPDIALSTDIMVGFPDETEEDFLDTLDLVKRVEYDNAFTFLYSKREGTRAYDMENQIPKEVKSERFNRLLETVYGIQNKKNQKLVGTEQMVLIEGQSKNNPEKMTGRTDTFKLVHMPYDESKIGTMVKVRIQSANTFSLEGDLIDIEK